MITTTDDREVGVQFADHEYNYRPNLTTKSCIQLIITITVSDKNKYIYFQEKGLLIPIIRDKDYSVIDGLSQVHPIAI